MKSIVKDGESKIATESVSAPRTKNEPTREFVAGVYWAALCRVNGGLQESGGFWEVQYRDASFITYDAQLALAHFGVVAVQAFQDALQEQISDLMRNEIEFTSTSAETDEAPVGVATIDAVSKSIQTLIHKINGGLPAW